MEGNVDGNQEYVYVGKKRRFDPKAIKDKLNFRKRRKRKDPFNSDHRYANSEDRYKNSEDRYKTDEERYASENEKEFNEEDVNGDNINEDTQNESVEDVTKVNRETVIVLCPKCHERYILPAHTLITFHCNNCNTKIEYDENTYGKEIVEIPKKPWYEFFLKIFRYSTYEAKIEFICTTKISAIPIVLMGILLITPLFIIFSRMLPEFGMGFYLDSIIILAVLIFSVRKLLLALKKMLVLFFPVFLVIVILLSIYTDYGIKYIFTGYTNLIKLEYGKSEKETKGQKIEKNKSYKISPTKVGRNK